MSATFAPALKIAGAAAAAAAAIIGVTTAAAWATQETAPAPRPAAAAADNQSIVETFEYPNAEAILAEEGVKLVSGDGHIIHASCTTPPVNNISVIEVHTSDIATIEDGIVCFRVLGNAGGYLKLEVPAVFEIRGDGRRPGSGHKITAIVQTEDGVLPPVAVNPSGSTQVGIGENEANKPTTLLELKVAA
jgi:hypothetical protein